ncbi:ABC-2 family transporter protein [Shuttleworthella sp. MSX8B]|uniref:YhgE/Pip domain-containing protein n=1 Tax=Shuttleworthella sp. MSX8B TaxID=936574 RepID=UPI00044A44E8|nr:YhgE/Pip domain-containing protein [Shuttleworthia sp. MSX8B]EUB12784.1 ABC-2 family transporter protein [Shuttleworthia sp. MSX8B]
MRNVFKVFRRDAKRIWTNVVALVVIMGLAVIPSLYAWFNILSNWDPYGSASTRNLKVAVATEDQGADLDGARLNIGDIVIDKLKSNQSIGWVFVDKAETAREGVTSGQYYAALVIDRDFSTNMLSFIGGQLNHPQIYYYENEKKNAIAPKITGKVKTTVQEEVNKAFVSSLAQGLLSAGKYISNTDGKTPLTDAALEHLKQMDSDMTTSIGVINAYISLADSADQVKRASEALSKELQRISGDSRSKLSVAKERAESQQSQPPGSSQAGQKTADYIESQLAGVSDYLGILQNQLADGQELAEPKINQLETLLDGLHSQINGALSAVHLPARLQARLDTFNQRYQTLRDRLEGMKAAARNGQSTLTLSKQAADDCGQLLSSSREILEDYQSQVKPKISASMDSIRNSMAEAGRLLSDAGANIDAVNKILASYSDLSGAAKGDLITARDHLSQMQGKLRDLINQVSELRSSDQYSMLIKLIESDPDLVADFISSPVGLKSESAYPIANNGSAMAAFYVILAIWVGALIQVAILRPRQKHPGEIPGVKPRHEFWGRYLIFFLLGQVQTLIIVLGTLFYVRIQVQSRLLFWLAAAVASLVFTLLLYALTYAFGAVGEAVGVVIMVVQVAGSGGTFPIEVLPRIYKILYPFMPFRYGINALRECVGGFYSNAYVIDLLHLLGFVPPALVIGLGISRIIGGLTHKIEASKAGSDLWA